jgi:hypothetical protein
MIVCTACGFKRCPRATFHGHACTSSNAPDQPGSRYTTSEEKLKHETVGRYLYAFGDVYLCFRWERRCGFWVRLMQKGEGVALVKRELGEEACISERAIGRTYHRRYEDDRYEAHVQPCDCSCCQPRVS